MSTPQIYVLVHPERYPSNDLDAALSYEDAEPFEDLVLLEVDDIDERYGAQVMAVAGQADRQIVVLDPSDVEMLVDDAMDEGLINDQDCELQTLADATRTRGGSELQVTVGAPAGRFELLQADPFEVADATAAYLADLPKDAEVVVGGFARGDCVARTIAAISELGLTVRECPLTTMPLTANAAVALERIKISRTS